MNDTKAPDQAQRTVTSHPKSTTMNPDRKLTEQEEELIAHLTKTYFLFPRDYWKTIAGGALAFLFVAGVLSWGAAKSALETAVAKQTTDEILALHRTAKERVDTMATDTGYVRYGAAVHVATGTEPDISALTNQDPNPIIRLDRSNYRQRWTFLPANK